MTIAEVFEKYKHLDELLSDPDFMPDAKDCDGCKLGRTLIGYMHEMWTAIKAEGIANTQEKAQEPRS